MFPFSFTIRRHSSHHKGRLGLLNTPHGVLETPAFIFCATKATVKGLTITQLKAAKTPIILSNTYHLMLQPGENIVAQQGGLHQFMGWDGPMLTDSGGFQIFSLGHGSVAAEIKGTRHHHRPKSLLKITEEGATFRSYINGQLHHLTPEKSVQIQKKLGADLIVVLDECTPFHVDKVYTEQSMQLSHRWALRSLSEFQKTESNQALYGIVQGGIYGDLRKKSAEFISEHPFFGHAIGGSLGANKEQMAEVIDMVMPYLSPQRPIHLLGIGGVGDIFSGVEKGIDTFDCVHPTRLARHGGALIQPHVLSDLPEKQNGKEHINLHNACFRQDIRPIDAQCPCETCTCYSRAYLHHLLKAKETLAIVALTIHNVCYMNRLLEDIRGALSTDTWQETKKRWIF